MALIRVGPLLLENDLNSVWWDKMQYFEVGKSKKWEESVEEN